MERGQKILIAVLSVIALGLGTFSFGYALGRDQTEEALIGPAGARAGVGAIRDAYNKIVTSSVDPPSEQKLTRAAIKAMIEVVKKEDPYALFYTPNGYRSFQEVTTGKFSGIGVWLKDKEGALEIVSVLPDSPALEAGLKRGDVIATIEGQEAEDMPVDEAVSKIKGPEGTKISLGIDREGERIPFTLTRATLTLPNLQSRMTEDQLGYIRLFGFARGAGDQVREKIENLTAQGAGGIILDLRDNGGGLFSEAIEVASVFIEDGKVVTYQERSADPITYDAEGDAFEDVPLVVLVNEGTASASEIVAGALQDRDHAILVGATTYGKGSVQEVLPLLDSSALKLTIGEYHTPNGAEINGHGIEPDVEVAAARLQRARAIEILKGIVLSTAGAQG